MRIFQLRAEGYIDPSAEFEYKQIRHYREAFPLVHNHDYYELFVVMDGTMEHYVNGSKMELQKGSLVFIRPSDYHSFHFREDECKFLNLAILERTIDELFSYLGKGFDSAKLTRPGMPPTLLLTAKELEEIMLQFDRLNILPIQDPARMNIELRVILINIFSRYFLFKQDHEEEMPDWLVKVITKMKKPENFREGIAAIKEIACKSDEHISRSFRKYLKQTPTQHVNSLRLNYSANQLRFSHRRIIDICFDAGFENLSNFHRQFKKMFNITPSAFRKANDRLSLSGKETLP